MRMYLMFTMKAFSNQLAYRSEVWLRLLGNFVTILIQVEIWRAVIGNGSVAGIKAEQMITYSIINTLLFALLLNGVSSKVDGSLKSGGIASELIKPLSYPLYLLFDGLGNSLYQLAFTVAPSLLIAGLFFGILPPATSTNFFAFLLALILALIISFLLGYLISLLAFWFMNHFALSWMMGGLITIFSGSFLPIWFSPYMGFCSENAAISVHGLCPGCHIFRQYNEQRAMAGTCHWGRMDRWITCPRSMALD